MPKCLITGCTLLDDSQERWVHGDLHQVGDTYVFNACMTEWESAWQYERDLSEGVRVLRVTGDFFERRGVIVAPAAHAVLNRVARDYLAGAS